VKIIADMNDIKKVALNSKKKAKHTCPTCGKSLSLNKPFCNTTCKLAHFDYIKIILSSKFIKRLAISCDDTDRYDELVKFSNYHKFNLSLVIKKFNEESIKLGYDVSSVIVKKG